MDVKPEIWQRYGLWFALAAFVATRAIIWIVAINAPQDRSRPNYTWSSVPTARWDVGHYNAILQDGYPPPVNGRLPQPPRSDTIAFFPGYPLVARPLARFMSPDAALVTVTHIASLLGMAFLYLWARRRCGPRTALWCVLLLSVYPQALFFSTGYADGLLFMYVAIILWLLDHGRLFPAALVCGLATATRPTGLPVAAIIVLWAAFYGPNPLWRPRRSKDGVHSDADRVSRPDICQPTDTASVGAGPLPFGGGGGRVSHGEAHPSKAIGTIPAFLRLAAIALISVSGFLAYQGWLWHFYGRPDAFSAVQSNWETKKQISQPLLRIVTLKAVVQPAFRPIKYALRGEFEHLWVSLNWNAFWNLAILVLAVVGLFRPNGIPRLLYLLPILVFLEAWLPDPYRGDRLVGIGRYQLIALPCFALLAGWMATRWPALLRYAFCATLFALQCVFIRDFVNWILVG